MSDLGMGGDEARKLETRVFMGRYESGFFRVEIHKIGVERGVSWEDAYAIWKDHHDDQVNLIVKAFQFQKLSHRSDVRN